MDLVVFENDKPFVIDEFREGRFDYIELASDVAETKFFQFLFGQQIVQKLAQAYPSPRDRHHVPLWMYVCSQLSLRLHGQHSFHSYPLIVRAGGLIDALGPEVARRPGSRGGITEAMRMMLDALARLLPGRRRDNAVTALSTMVGAVVLARIADDPELANEFLAVAAAAVVPGGIASPA